MPFTGFVQVTVDSRLTVQDSLRELVDAFQRSVQVNFANGNGLNQAANIYTARRTLTTGANENLDLSGVLSNPFGVSVVLTKLKALIVSASNANTTNLTITRPASNGVPFLAAAGDGFVLTPGGIFVLADPSAAGIVVTPGTGDLINVANAAGASATYDVYIIGA